jgi:hypothetical protein
VSPAIRSQIWKNIVLIDMNEHLGIYSLKSINLDPKASKLRGFWHKIDNKYIKPFLIEDWPNVKYDHDEVSVKIINLFDEHQRKKMKSKEIRSFSQSKEKIENLLNKF